jgi:hypothetical protein
MKVNILNTARDGKSGNYCGRGSPLGNYAFREGMTRDEACEHRAERAEDDGDGLL